MFWHVSQNNSGGSFDFNEEYGITHHLVIEAPNVNAANAIYNYLINSYPNRGGDCPCCGDRWGDELYGDGKETPMVYGQPVQEYKTWIKFLKEKEICVHYLDGRKEWFDAEKRKSGDKL